MRRAKRRGKIVAVIVLIVALAVLVPLGSFLYVAVPGGTSFAAKQLCSLVFVSGFDPERAMEISVKAVISPLAVSPSLVPV